MSPDIYPGRPNGISPESVDGQTEILVVDDDLSILELLGTLLPLEGYKVALFSDSLEALEAALAKRPGIVISDVKMPRMNGYEFLKRLDENEFTRGTPFIFSTASGRKNERPERAGWVSKPYDLDRLLEAISRRLNGSIPL
ncbi:response regulator [Candidatus Daviesbacteria bacterium]|nr:response regulator [Candidatus Daviesbacteria bacterium]